MCYFSIGRGLDIFRILVSDDTCLLLGNYRGILHRRGAQHTFKAKRGTNHLTFALSRQLRLGLINGPNEGLAIVASLSILTALVGPEFWKLDVFGIGINW